MSGIDPSLLHGVLLAWSLMAVATLSPGPANLAITAAALADGRRAALAMSAGVSLVSLGWGLAAAAGLTALLSRYGWTLTVLRFAGGAYLLWLAWKSLRSALRADTPDGTTGESSPSRRGIRASFRRGVLLHLVNPKPVFAWLAVIAVGVGASESPSLALSLLVVALCWTTAAGVFAGYALVFSTRRAQGVHRRFRRRIDGVVALLFGAAGLRLLTLGR